MTSHFMFKGNIVIECFMNAERTSTVANSLKESRTKLRFMMKQLSNTDKVKADTAKKSHFSQIKAKTAKIR